MKGHVLYHLNEVKSIFPEIYNKNLERYKDRKYHLKQKIPYLDCLWNDVVHLTAIKPIKIKKALEKAGAPPFVKKWKWYKIDSKNLDESNAVIFLYNNKKDERKRRFEKDNFLPYKGSDLSKYSILSKAVENHYLNEVEQGKKLKEIILFHLVPHILYKGNIDISNTEIIEI